MGTMQLLKKGQRARQTSGCREDVLGDEMASAKALRQERAHGHGPARRIWS